MNKNQISFRAYSILNWVLLLLCLLPMGCKTSFHYSFEDESGPVFEGNFRNLEFNEGRDTLLIVSLNIEFANHFEEAIDLLRDGKLKDFDILLLQEMDEKSTHKMAKELECEYIYYPSINHPKQKKLVGNAILSRWPIKSRYKLKLPHPSVYPMPLKFTLHKFRKTSTVALIKINNQEIAFYSLHGAAIKPSESRGNISKTIVNDILLHNYTQCMVGGDFNTVGWGDINQVIQPFDSINMEWITKEVGRTIGSVRSVLFFIKSSAFQADHLFSRNLRVGESGKIETDEISDHYPIWAKIIIDQ